MYRSGIGYDIHLLVEGRKLFIGGVEIPYIKGLLGHSDADVLLHAICDAFLGAMGQGDIGEHFPDTDPKYENISSVQLLDNVIKLLHHNKYKIINVDTIVIAQEPKLIPFKKQMLKKISEILGVKEDQVNIKAKTNEGMGEIGRSEAIAAYATAVISREGSL